MANNQRCVSDWDTCVHDFHGLIALETSQACPLSGWIWTPKPRDPLAGTQDPSVFGASIWRGCLQLGPLLQGTSAQLDPRPCPGRQPPAPAWTANGAKVSWDIKFASVTHCLGDIRPLILLSLNLSFLLSALEHYYLVSGSLRENEHDSECVCLETSAPWDPGTPGWDLCFSLRYGLSACHP